MRLKPLYLAAAAALAAAAIPLLSFHVAADDLDKEIPAAQSDPANPAAIEVAVLAGGCFWGQQGLFEHVTGVTKVVAGYSGGGRQTAMYDRVSDGDTGQCRQQQLQRRLARRRAVAQRAPLERLAWNSRICSFIHIVIMPHQSDRVRFGRRRGT